MKGAFSGKRGLVSTLLFLCGFLVTVFFCYAQVKKYPPLTDWDLKNGEYHETLPKDGLSEKTFKLSEGRWYKNDPYIEDYGSQIYIFKIAYGDLNGDGNRDAAIVWVENDYKAQGFFYEVVIVLNDNGQAKHVATKFIDNKPGIEKFYIKNGSVCIQVVMHDGDDHGCCPTHRKLLKYTIKDSTVVEERINLGTIEEGYISPGG